MARLGPPPLWALPRQHRGTLGPACFGTTPSGPCPASCSVSSAADATSSSCVFSLPFLSSREVSSRRKGFPVSSVHLLEPRYLPHGTRMLIYLSGKHEWANRPVKGPSQPLPLILGDARGFGGHPGGQVEAVSFLPHPLRASLPHSQSLGHSEVGPEVTGPLAGPVCSHCRSQHQWGHRSLQGPPTCSLPPPWVPGPSPSPRAPALPPGPARSGSQDHARQGSLGLSPRAVGPRSALPPTSFPPGPVLWAPLGHPQSRAEQRATPLA